MKSPNRRPLSRLAAIAGLTASALALTACSSGGGGGTSSSSSSWSLPSKDPKATIHVLSHLLLTGPGSVAPVVQAFEKAHPSITIKWDSVPFDQLASTVDAHVTNKGGNPDVYWADQPRISALASRGEAEDLTSVFGKTKSTFDAPAYNTGLYNNKLYALPIANSTQLLYYNKDLLKKAGITPPSASVDSRMTWDQLQADALKAKKAGATYGFTFGQFDRYYQLEPLPLEQGGSTGLTGKGNLTPDVTSAAWVKAFDWYGGLFKSGAAPKGMTADQTDPAFVAGKVAYTVEGPWLLSQLQGTKVNWGVAPQPTFTSGGKAATPNGSWSVAMNPFSKQKEAAAVFMNWLAVQNGYIKYETSPELPATPAGKELYFKRPVFSSSAGQDATKIMASESTQTAVARPSTIGYIEFETIMNQTFSDIRNGADAKQALESAQSKLTTAFSKYK
jgi:ABC-type glycerol-3-phosphate transport system substrate-binding protein